MRCHVIATDTENLSPQLLQPVVVLPKRGSLGRSAGGEIEHMEGKHDVFLASELAETYGLIIGRGQGKVGGHLSDISRHRLSFLTLLPRYEHSSPADANGIALGR